MKESRQFPRYAKRLQARYSVGGERSRLGFTGDISPMGVYVQTGRPPDVGHEVEILVRLPNDDEVTLEGVVRWSRPAPQRLARRMHAGFGIMLTQAPEAWYAYCMDLAFAAASNAA